MATTPVSHGSYLVIILYFRIPWWGIYVSWTLAIGFSLVASYFIVLYGLNYGYNTSVSWLISFMTGFGQSTGVMQPIKV